MRAVVAGRGERDLPFEIEVILAAAAEFTGQAMRRPGECSRSVAADNVLRRGDKLFARKRIVDGQHCGQQFVLDSDQLGGGARLIERNRRHGGDRLALVLDKIGGEERFVGANGTDVVLAGNICGRDRRHDAGRG